MLTKNEIMLIREQIAEVAIDGPHETCCRQWKPIEDLIKVITECDAFQSIYTRKN